jgi:hypothetical protein
LPQVVAGRGEELRLGAAGGLGRAAGLVGGGLSTRSWAASWSVRAFSEMACASALRWVRPITSVATKITPSPTASCQ